MLFLSLALRGVMVGSICDGFGGSSIRHRYDLVLSGSSTTANNLRILCLNIRSIKKKLNCLEEIIVVTKPDVIVLTETWLQKYDEKFYNLKGYTSFHSIRKIGELKRGGGTSIFVDEGISANKFFEARDDFCNILGVSFPKLKCNIFGIYNSNNPKNNNSFFLTSLNRVLTDFKGSIVCGDTNIDLLKYSRLKSEYMDIIGFNGFNILNNISTDMPTRLNENYSTVSILDHFFTDLFKYDYTITISKCPVSDHNMIYCDVNLKVPIVVANKFESVFINEEAVCFDILQHNMCSVNSYSEMVEPILKSIHNNTKSFTHKKKNNKPYIDNETLKLIKEKNRLYKMHKKFPESIIVKSNYVQARNKLTNLCNYKKRIYYSKQLENNVNDPRKMWGIFNEILFNRINKSKNMTLPTKLVTDKGDEIVDKKSILDALNHSFVTAAISDKKTTVSEDECDIAFLFNENQFNFRHVTESEVSTVIKNLKSNTASGSDQISCKLIKNLNSKLTPVIVKLLNQMFDTNVFPDELKQARVVPLYKSGEINDCCNYRSISVLPSLSKPFESIMLDQITEFLRLNKILNNNQFGFLAKSNTNSACLQFVSMIQSSMDQGYYTACLAVDLRKAFDSVNHSVLLSKLKKYGFSYESLNLLGNYLSGRKQFIKVGNVISSNLNISAGVPQGSILGPILFVILINDLFDLKLNGDLTNYADDTMLTYKAVTIDELNRQMNTDLTILREYFEKTKLQMNLKKTEFMLIGKAGRHSERFLLKLDNQVIQQTKSMIYLGLSINNNFDWSTHIQTIKQKCVPFISIFYRLSKFTPSSVLIKLYFAHIHSRLLYLNSIWSLAPQYLINQLKVIQNRIIKSIFRLDRLTPSSLLYSEYILPFEILSKYESITVMYKILKNKVNHNFQFIKNQEIHTHVTRQSSLLHIPTINSYKFGKNTFSYHAIHLYNDLPNNLKLIENTKEFQIELKQYLFKQYLENN